MTLPSCPSRASADLLRVAACVAVVVIHGGGEAVKTWHPGVSWDVTTAVIADQVARFSFPIFVLLSGHGLMARRLAKPNERLGAFWLGRMERGLLPLAVFSLLWVVIHAVAWGDWAARLTALPMQMLTGSTDYHLYFLPAILGCWLLLPLIAWIGPHRLLPLAAAWQVLLCQPSAYTWVGIDPSPAGAPWLHAAFAFVLTLKWLPWFIVGMWSATRPPAEGGILARWSSLAAVAATATWTLWDFLAAVAHGAPVDAVQHFHRLSVTAFGLATWWAWLSWDASLGRLGSHAWIHRAAGLSFTVYLVHPTILRAWDLAGVAQPQVRILVALAGATLIAGVLDRWLPWGRPAVGLEPLRRTSTG